MKIDPRAQAIHADATLWRRAMHEHPQTAYEETFASDLVAKHLTNWGIPFERGIAETGIVATIDGQLPTNASVSSPVSIGLRADMDALDIEEQSEQPWRSRHAGKMHACGHDGHTSILLGTAKVLNDSRQFAGKVHLIFQPAEEGRRGADRMLEEGLFERFPCRQIFGIHNSPWLPLGHAELRPGPMLAAVDEFQITLQGTGGHAAYPQVTRDVIPAISELVLALQSIVSRNVSPTEHAVVSVTNLHAGTGAFNVLGDTASLSGTTRTFDATVRDMIEHRIRRITSGISQAHGLHFEINYERPIEATVNSPHETRLATQVLRRILGEGHVNDEGQMVMGGEDFGAMLRNVPGAFAFLGQCVMDEQLVDDRVPAPTVPQNQPLHSAWYDFNDDLLPVGISYFVALVETLLPLNVAK